MYHMDGWIDSHKHVEEILKGVFLIRSVRAGQMMIVRNSAITQHLAHSYPADIRPQTERKILPSPIYMLIKESPKRLLGV